MSNKKKRKLRGTVEKVIKRSLPKETEKVQIGVHEADELYCEIRVENTLCDDEGQTVQLKPGAEVDVILEADSHAVVKENETRADPSKNEKQSFPKPFGQAALLEPEKRFFGRGFKV